MLHDMKGALRALSSARRVTALIVLMLGIGIGLNVSLLTVVNAAFLRPLPFATPERLVFLYASFPGLPAADLANFSFPDFEDVRRQASSFEAIAAQSDFTAAAIEGRDGAARVQPNFIDGPYLDILGTAPAAGRAFTAEEMRNAAPVAILSYGAWHRIFGGDAAMIGRSVRVNGLPVEIVGIMPEGFVDLAEREGRQVDLLLPLRLAPRLAPGFNPDNRAGRLLWGVARLRDGVTAADAERELEGLSDSLERDHPQTNRGFGVHATPLRRVFFTELRQPLALLGAGGLFVLVIVCGNAAVLLVARGLARRHELALRIALGASRGRIVRQMLLELVLIATAAAIFSLLTAGSVTRALLAAGTIEFPAFVDTGLDTTVVILGLFLTFITAIGAGVLPAITAWREAKGTGLVSAGTPRVVSRHRIQLALVALQVASAVVLVAAASLMVASSTALARTGLGFDTARLLTLRVDLPANRYGEPAARVAFAAGLRETLAAIPGVASATLWGPGLPGRATWVAFIAPEERPIHSPADLQMVWRHSTNPGGLAALRIRLLEGRDFTSGDTADGQPVAIVGRSLAQELWPGKSPLGQRIRTATAANAPLVTIVGVADDVWMRGRFRFGDLDPRRIPQRDIYFPYAQRPNTGLVLLVRGSADTAVIADPVRRAVAAADPSLPVYELRTMSEVMQREEQIVRLAALLLATYGVLGLLLAGSGIYAVLSFAVVRRAREIGVRMALGARRSQIVADVSRDGLKSVALGCLAGAAILAVMSPVVRSLFFGVVPHDPRVLSLACVALVFVALAASAAPAWRAASVDPSTVLRDQ